jgi:hypothetical protein
MKQTAVEWLVEELSDVLGPMDTNSIRDLLLMDAINRAKEMEKEQIEDAHIEGQRVFDDYPHTQWTNDQAEAYYKNTYNKQ